MKKQNYIFKKVEEVRAWIRRLFHLHLHLHFLFHLLLLSQQQQFSVQFELRRLVSSQGQTPEPFVSLGITSHRCQFMSLPIRHIDSCQWQHWLRLFQGVLYSLNQLLRSLISHSYRQLSLSIYIIYLAQSVFDQQHKNP